MYPPDELVTTFYYVMQERVAPKAEEAKECQREARTCLEDLRLAVLEANQVELTYRCYAAMQMLDEVEWQMDKGDVLTYDVDAFLREVSGVIEELGKLSRDLVRVCDLLGFGEAGMPMGESPQLRQSIGCLRKLESSLVEYIEALQESHALLEEKNEQFDSVIRVADAGPWSPLHDAAPESPSMGDVRFVAVSPHEICAGDFGLVDIVMHEDGWEDAVKDIIDEHEEQVRKTDGGWTKAKYGTRVRVELTSRELGDLGSEECVWQGRYARFGFVVDVPASFERPKALLCATAYFDDVPATRLRFVVACVRPDALADRARRAVVPEREDVRAAFISYASQDRARVATIIQGMRTVRPDLDIFFDVEKLRSGEDWQSALMREIGKSDVLFLCWSRNARASRWVDFEWRYALGSKGEECIEPVAIEMPSLCPPPEELSKKHFSDPLLYVINAESDGGTATADPQQANPAPRDGLPPFWLDV